MVYGLGLLQRYVRAIAIDLDGADLVLGQASCLQEWTVLTHLHTLACEVVSIKQLQSVVLSMLGRIMACQPCPPSKLSDACGGAPFSPADIYWRLSIKIQLLNTKGELEASPSL